jgi:uncharacterized surface protein with fasciclin (FAS1) repeats
MAPKIIATVAGAVGVGLAAAACTSTAAPAPKAVAGHIQARTIRALSQRPGHLAASAPGATRTIGPDCAGLAPAGRPGRSGARVRLPVAAAIARTRVLSDLARAIRLAGLAKTLDSARALTVFAPDNAAFAAIGAANRQALLATRPALTRLLTFHVVAGLLTPAGLARHRVLTTLGGTKLHLSKSGPAFYVNSTRVACGNLRAANATVYIVNEVIVPGA